MSNIPVLIGSLAFNCHRPKDNIITARDIDIVGSYDTVMNFAKTTLGEFDECYPISGGKKMVFRKNKTIIEAEIAWDDGSTADDIVALGEHFPTDYVSIDLKPLAIKLPPLSFLYTLKMSHRYLKDSPHFLKTMQDIREMRAYLQSAAIISYPYQDFYKKRMKETYVYKHPKLNQTKSNFFANDGIKYIYDHDTIHQAMKHMERPAFDYFKPDTNDVLCSKDQFFACDEIIRNYAVLEETYVLALERSQIPFDYLPDPRKSFDKAHQKVCSSITSGWFREYAWENYDLIQSMYNQNYVLRFKKALEDGIIRPYK